jgi:hypothetical protein
MRRGDVMPERAKPTPPWYWILAAILIAFGVIGLASIGLPFLLVGLTLLFLAPHRAKPATFWPALLAVLAFIAGYVLVSPLSCTESALAGSGQLGHTSCFNLLGIDYAGRGVYNPPLWPALLAGVAAGLMTGFVSRWILSRRSRSSSVGQPA